MEHVKLNKNIVNCNYSAEIPRSRATNGTFPRSRRRKFNAVEGTRVTKSVAVAVTRLLKEINDNTAVISMY